MKYVVFCNDQTEVLVLVSLNDTPVWAPFGDERALRFDNPSEAVQTAKDLQRMTGAVCGMTPVDEVT